MPLRRNATGVTLQPHANMIGLHALDVRLYLEQNRKNDRQPSLYALLVFALLIRPCRMFKSVSAVLVRLDSEPPKTKSPAVKKISVDSVTVAYCE